MKEPQALSGSSRPAAAAAAGVSPWTGRVDREDGEAGLRWHQVVRGVAPSRGAVSGAAFEAALLGLPSDLGVAANQGRVGAAEGPFALRRALANLAFRGDGALVDAGDVAVGDDLAASQRVYAERLAQLLDDGRFVLGLGGGHEIGFAGFLGCRRHVDRVAPGARLGILNLDAHLDLREPVHGPTSGTPFLQAAEYCRGRGQAFDYACLGVAPPSNTRALHERAREWGVLTLDDLDFTVARAARVVEQLLVRVDYLYVTCCLDVFAAAHAPGVSAPAAVGVEPRSVLQLLRGLGERCARHDVRWLCADVAELAPRFDEDGRTARLGARVLEQCFVAAAVAVPSRSGLRLQRAPATTAAGPSS